MQNQSWRPFDHDNGVSRPAEILLIYNTCSALRFRRENIDHFRRCNSIGCHGVLFLHHPRLASSTSDIDDLMFSTMYSTRATPCPTQPILSTRLETRSSLRNAWSTRSSPLTISKPYRSMLRSHELFVLCPQPVLSVIRAERTLKKLNPT